MARTHSNGPLSSLAIITAVTTTALMLSACQAESAYQALTSPPSEDFEGDTTGLTGVSGVESSGESASVTITAVTSDTGSGGSSATLDTDGVSDTDGTDGGDTDDTEGSDAGPPELVGVSLAPQPIVDNGLITAEVHATASDGVRLTLDTGATIELDEAAPGTFTGAFPVLTGLDNGPHIATVTPWRGDIDGESADAAYTIALPEPGTELYWETGDLLLGKGWVDAVGLLSTGELIELGTRLDDQDVRRCYLRRRNPDGGWGSQDVIDIMPGQECKGVDLVVRENGTIHALVSWKVNADEWSWWLSDIPQWGTNPLTMASGAAGEDATALAYRDGVLAICGAVPSGFGDLDAFIRVLGLEAGPMSRTFDYLPQAWADEDVHWFDETPLDCALSDADTEMLVLVGEARGEHVKEIVRSRRFMLPVDLGGDEVPVYSVGEAGLVSQSYATAVDVSPDGEVVATGYICGYPCDQEVEGRLWLYDLAGDEEWESALGVFSYPFLAPHALRWSFAGYMVIGHGGLIGDDNTFMVRAFKPLLKEPLWTYSRVDPFATHWSTALTVGPFGRLCAGGFGASTYPAVACFGS